MFWLYRKCSDSTEQFWLYSKCSDSTEHVLTLQNSSDSTEQFWLYRTNLTLQYKSDSPEQFWLYRTVDSTEQFWLYRTVLTLKNSSDSKEQYSTEVKAYFVRCSDKVKLVFSKNVSGSDMLIRNSTKIETTLVVRINLTYTVSIVQLYSEWGRVAEPGPDFLIF